MEIEKIVEMEVWK